MARRAEEIKMKYRITEEELSEKSREMVAQYNALEDPDWDAYSQGDVEDAISFLTRNGDRMMINFLGTAAYDDWVLEYEDYARSCWDEDLYISAGILDLQGAYLVEYWVGDDGCIYLTTATYEEALEDVKAVEEYWKKWDQERTEGCFCRAVEKRASVRKENNCPTLPCTPEK